MDSRKPWFAIGDYKRLENEVGSMATASPKDVPAKTSELISACNGKSDLSLENLLAFHCEFEVTRPFQNGNGRVGRLILFKECLRNGTVPFIIEDDVKQFYYRGSRNGRASGATC